MYVPVWIDREDDELIIDFRDKSGCVYDEKQHLRKHLENLFLTTKGDNPTIK